MLTQKCSFQFPRMEMPLIVNLAICFGKKTTFLISPAYTSVHPPRNSHTRVDQFSGFFPVKDYIDEVGPQGS